MIVRSRLTEDEYQALKKLVRSEPRRRIGSLPSSARSAGPDRRFSDRWFA